MCKFKSIVEHYNHLIDDHNDPVHDPKSLQEYMDKWDGNVFLHELNFNKESIILEIGVGTGRLALKVLERGCKHLYGIDLSQKTINRADENLSMFSNYQLMVGDYLKIHIEQTFDIIYSSLTFFHIEDKAAAIKKTWTLLKPTGKFVLSIDKNSQKYLDYGTYKVKLFPDDYIDTYSLLERCGFKIKSVMETEFAYLFSAIK